MGQKEVKKIEEVKTELLDTLCGKLLSHLNLVVVLQLRLEMRTKKMLSLIYPLGVFQILMKQTKLSTY